MFEGDVTKSQLEASNQLFINGNWVHVVAVRDAINDLLKLHADWVLVTSTDPNDDGKNRTDGSGDIDNVRIFPLTLTEDDIAAIA